MYMYVNVAVESIRALGSIPRVPPRRSLPPWEVKILAAQNIIFNQELFSQVHVFVTLSALHNAWRWFPSLSLTLSPLLLIPSPPLSPPPSLADKRSLQY